MPDFEGLGIMLPMFALYPLMFISIVYLPDSLKLVGAFGAEAMMGVWAVSARKIAGLLAGHWHWVNFRFTSRGPPSGWTYSGLYNFRRRDQPKTIGYLKDFVRPDGTGKGAYLTPYFPQKTKLRHPFYNNRGRFKCLFILHPYPWANQFTEGRGRVSLGGTPASISTYAWGVAHEIMPSKTYFTDPSSGLQKGVLNHVPFVDLDLYQIPWYYITDSSGARTIREDAARRQRVNQAVRRPVIVESAKGPQTLLCLDCGRELPAPDKDGFSTCSEGHQWDMRAKR